MAIQVQSNDIQAGQARTFVQYSTTPKNGFVFAGCTSVGEVTQSFGDLTPNYCPDPNTNNFWVVTSKTRGAPELPTLSLSEVMDANLTNVWIDLGKQGCPVNIAVYIGACRSPNDPKQWDSILIYQGLQLTSNVYPALNPLDPGENARLLLNAEGSFNQVIAIRKLFAGTKAESVVSEEIVDGFYNDAIACGDCGEQSDGCQKQYWLSVASVGSPGLSAQIIGSTDDKATYFKRDITPLGGVSANRMTAVGNYVVVVSTAYAGHVFATFDAVDAGTAGAFTGVTTGYVALKQPTSIYSKNPQQTFVAGNGGYVYLLTDPTGSPTVLEDGTQTIQNLSDIHGSGRTIIAGGASGALIVSDNDGATWSLVTTPVAIAAQTITSVHAVTNNIWWIGTSAGAVYYTVNGGATWTLKTFTGATNIPDIKFQDSSIGYVLTKTASSTIIYWTLDSGANWYTGDPRLNKIPSGVNQWNVIALCDTNEVSFGGRKTVGGDGIIAIASS